MISFRTTTFGKWILAGEHAVLRGSPALAFPLFSRNLEISFHPSSAPLSVEFFGDHGNELNLLFFGVLDQARMKLGVSENLTGHFAIRNMIPIGAGLGASAALCGGIGRWCVAQGWVDEGRLYEFSRDLEDFFHGESSGVDIAVSLSGNGVRFVRGGDRTSLIPTWWPKFFLSYSGQRGMTSDCVQRVKAGFVSDRTRAEALDLKMRQAVDLASDALLAPEGKSAPSWQKIQVAVEMAGECFVDWGLCEGAVGSHIARLRHLGATAVKPTGSGGGGYVLSLWENDPPPELAKELLPVTGAINKEMSGDS